MRNIDHRVLHEGHIRLRDRQMGVEVLLGYLYQQTAAPVKIKTNGRVEGRKGGEKEKGKEEERRRGR